MKVNELSSFVCALFLIVVASALGSCSSDAGTAQGNGTGGGRTGSGGLFGSGGSRTTGSGGTGAAVPAGAAGSAGSAGSAPAGGTGGTSPTGGMPGAGGRRVVGTGGVPGTGGWTGPPQITGPCTAVPVNPRATQQTKNLLCYLYSQYGNHVLSGQQETSWRNPANDISFYVTNTGKSPAILGGDYLYPTGTSARAIAYWNAGGIPLIRYHMGAPPSSDSYTNAMGSVNLVNVVTAGTAENRSFNTKLDFAASEIKTLQDANVPLLWAPFHEVQANGWFWWAKGTGPQFVELWKYMFNYFTTTKGLNNIVWLLPFSGSVSMAFYPGKDFVDIGGPDTYGTNQPFTSTFTGARLLFGNTMPLALHETGVIPQPIGMFPATAPWILFNVWAGFETSANTMATIQSTYSSPFTVTRDEVPNLK
jgi:Glycosyl hydrolase family 26